ncbi:MAG: apolipoprotein N-acyltransferase [Sulfurifustis sp.]
MTSPTAAHAATRGEVRRDLAALLAGVATPFAFAPFDLYPLAVLAPAVLFALWLPASAARAAWRGFLYGVGLFGVGVSWVFVSMHTFGNMPPALATLAVALFVAGLALFPAAAGGLQARFAPLATPTRLALVMPAIWTLLEWIRGWFLTGFPWLNLGYSQTDTPLAGLASWLGVYGMSFAVAVSAGLLAAIWFHRRRAAWYFAAAVLLWVVADLAGRVEWAQPASASFSVGLVQGNIPLAIKWRPEYREKIVSEYLSLSELAPQARLIVWPEAAVPGYFDLLAPTLVPPLERIARERGTEFLIGAIERDARGRAYYNSVYAVGSHPGSYRKQHLVPFGEFLPFPAAFRWFIEQLHIPMSDFAVGGAGQTLLYAGGQPLGVSVCYEDAFGEEIVSTLPAARLLVNVSEDSWFGNSLAPHQRLQMARVRALEAGRWMLRAANTGPSAIIDHHGNVVRRSMQFVPYVLTGVVQPMEGATPYVRFGNYPIVVLAMLIALGAYAPRLRKVPMVQVRKSRAS